MSRFECGAVELSPRDAGYDEAKIRRLEEHYARRIESGKLQAAGFLMAREGKIFAHKAMGRLTYKKDSPPFRTDSIKTIASISKIITATAVMKLVEDGMLWLEQSVKDFIREFDTPMHGAITLWHLLTHTSGLAGDAGYYMEPYPIERHDLLSCKDWLTKAVLPGPVQARPGEKWIYCSAGFAVLAEIVSRVSGMHFNDFVEKKIFRPIGMTRSFLEVPEDLLPETCLMWDGEEGFIRGHAKREGAPLGGGGVHSTLQDLFRFGQCFLNGGELDGGRILGKKTVQEMTRNQLSGVPAYHWGKNLKEFRQGLGWGFFCDGSTVGPSTYSHEGWGWCALFVDPVERFIFVSTVADPNPWNPEHVVEPRAIAFSGIL